MGLYRWRLCREPAQYPPPMKHVLVLPLLSVLPCAAESIQTVEANRMAEVAVVSEKAYQYPFVETYATPSVKVANVSHGKAGLWLCQIGERQEYDNFALSRTPFAPDKLDAAGDVRRVRSADFRAPNVPSPQDWVLVMERVKP